MKTISENSRRLSLAALFSLAIHLLALGILPISHSPTTGTSPRPPIRLEMISPEKLKEYRSVGIKNGSQYFSLPVAPATPRPPSLSLQSLSPTASTQSIVTPPPLKRAETGKPSTKNLKISPNNSIAASFLRKTNLSIQFEPPEGVSEDELNDAEKTFWSFKKRAYRTYVTSLLSTYRQSLKNQPQIKNTLRKIRNHVVAGKMVFDEKGNVLRIKIVRPSEHDDIQFLFEQSLRNIHKIPNPPKGLLADNGELTLYYQLVINR